MSPEDVAALIEDAVLLRDDVAVQALWDPGGVVVGPDWVAGPGRAMEVLGGYLAAPMTVFGPVALSVGERNVPVLRCAADRRWNVVATITRTPTV